MDMSDMDMGGMDMGGMDMGGMDMGGMDMGGMDMGGMDMGGMDMDMSGMNMYFTTKYTDYPVIFKTLKASSGGAAFGIFCVLFFGAFALRGLSFLSLYLEQKVWKTQSVNITIDECECDDDDHDHNAPRIIDDAKHSEDNTDEPTGGCCGGSETPKPAVYDPEANKSNVNSHQHRTSIVIANRNKVQVNNISRSHRSVLAQLFAPGFGELYKDLIRLVIYFVTAMFSFVLMIAAMSYVLLYFFAICLGLAFGEVFFNRLRIASGLNDNINGVCGNLH